jgi:CRP-like cAMP-binding protein
MRANHREPDKAASFAYRMLRRIDTLACLSDAQVRKLSKLCVIERFRAKAIVAAFDSPAFLLRGAVRLVIAGRGRRPTLARIVAPGELITGFHWIGGLHTASVIRQCMVDSTVARIDADSFAQVVAGTTWVSIAPLVRIVSQAVYAPIIHYSALFGQTLAYRLAQQLKDLADKFGVGEPHCTQIALPITHEDIAALVGCSARQEQKQMQKFQASKIVVTVGRQMTVDLQKLEIYMTNLSLATKSPSRGLMKVVALSAVGSKGLDTTRTRAVG